MKNDNKILEDKLPRNCCTFCSHLSLEGADMKTIDIILSVY